MNSLNAPGLARMSTIPASTSKTRARMMTVLRRLSRPGPLLRAAPPSPALDARTRQGLRRLLFLLLDQDRALAGEDDLAGDDALLEAGDGGELVHHFEHD